MADITREKDLNDGEVEKKQQEISVPENKNPFLDTSSSDSDFKLEFTCETCHKSFSGIKPLRQHEKSAQHLKRIRKKEVEKKLAKKLEEDAEEIEEDDHDQTPFAFCETCKKDFMGPESLEQHLKSSKHQKKMATSKLLKEIKDENGHISLEKLKQKRKEKKSKKGIPLVVGKTEHNIHSGRIEHSGEHGACGYSGPPESSEDSPNDDLITETHEFECLDCKKVFTGVNPWYQHLVSKVHEKTLKQKELFDQLRIIGTMANEYSTDQYLVQEDDDDVIFCKLCTVAFSGPESASAHLKSKKHKKNLELKKWKNAMKEERRELRHSLKIKKKATFESSGGNSSEIRSSVHEQELQETKEIKLRPSCSVEKDTYLTSSNATEDSSEGRRKQQPHVVNDDELKSQLKASANEETENLENFNLASFKETTI